MAEANAQKGTTKEPKNIVHQQAILVETIKKEIREGKMYENFSINPFIKREILSRKPNTYPDDLENEADGTFIEMIRRANLEPTKKYKAPQTTSQEYGWITTPLIENDKSDRRLNYQRNLTEICAYAEEYFRFNPKKPAVKKGSE